MDEEFARACGEREDSCWLEVVDGLGNQPDTIVVHMDADVNDSGVAVSLMARNWKGELVSVAFKLILACSPTTTELKALDCAIDTAMIMGLPKVPWKCDSKASVKADLSLGDPTC